MGKTRLRTKILNPAHVSTITAKQNLSPYSRFDQIDGSHPWASKVPLSIVPYQVREINKGKVTYFNFDLAIEMGLLEKNHVHKLNRELEKKLLKIFSIRIINEYDIKAKKIFPKETIKPNHYMATRYLQLQHENKQGKTSGDGRSIWNGYFKGNGKIWDISSRGTGVTCLAPGSVESKKPIQTGNESIGYGCGLLEIDELYGSAICSEIFHKHNINTERVLLIIDTGDGHGIGVRVGENLFRPAHLFSLLKQNDYLNLKKAVDFLIERQNQNKKWGLESITSSKKRYDQMLEILCTNFAKFAARLDVDYIFAWMDWDGDNVLFDAGIIDYGSIRQFGVRHDKYRYDDVDRFSTTLNEQKQKAKFLVQVYAQITEFLKTSSKPALQDMKDHPILQKFDEEFNHYYLKYRLYNIGLPKQDSEFLMEHNLEDVKNFEVLFKYFEKQKTQNNFIKLPDGINHPAIFNLRNLLRELPMVLKNKDTEGHIEPQVLFDLMLVQDASPKDKKMSASQKEKLIQLQTSYINLIQAAKRYRSTQKMLAEIESRSRVINRADRMTGNAVIMVVEKIIHDVKKGFPLEEIQGIIDNFIQTQVLLPNEGLQNPEEVLKHKPNHSKKLLSSLLSIVRDHKEDI